MVSLSQTRKILRSQFGSLKYRADSKFNIIAFTEHGVAMVTATSQQKSGEGESTDPHMYQKHHVLSNHVLIHAEAE